MLKTEDIGQVLEKLAIQRQRGIELWHEGAALLSKQSVDSWWEKHLLWREECAQIIQIFDVSLAGKMRTLGIGEGVAPKGGISDDHKHKIWMQSAWNKRLDEIIEELRENQG